MLVNTNFWPVNMNFWKAATMKSFDYSPLGKELKAQTDLAKKQYQKLGDTYEFDKTIKKEMSTYSKL